MRTTLLILIIFISSLAAAQTYFPPLTGNQWETKSASDLGWCTDSIPALLNFVGQNNSKAFLVLVDGRIVIENYYGTFNQDSFWYWASAGKSMLATVVGIAAEQNLLNINNASSTYLNTGWTNCSTTDEQKIKIVHQLSMNSGINDNVPDVDCTEPSCLTCLAEPGTRWAYHNAVYTLLEEVIVNASSQTLNQFLNTNIKLKTGMSGLYIKQGYNNVYFSTARSMARFGLLAQNNFVWNTDTVLKDGAFKTQMTNSSQNINPSYGYLWWLNGKNKFMLPGLQVVFNGMLTPDAPTDMYSAMGKNGQLINVVPSKKMVVVRMGNKPADQNELPMIFNNEIWKRLNTIMCNATTISHQAKEKKLSIYPNPSQNEIFINGITNLNYCIKNVNGQIMQEGISEGNKISIEKLSIGVYSLEIEGIVLRIVKM
jgi:CubicO group peptidase (beta-lactamase class C family)